MIVADDAKWRLWFPLPQSIRCFSHQVPSLSADFLPIFFHIYSLFFCFGLGHGLFSGTRCQGQGVKCSGIISSDLKLFPKRTGSTSVRNYWSECLFNVTHSAVNAIHSCRLCVILLSFKWLFPVVFVHASAALHILDFKTSQITGCCFSFLLVAYCHFGCIWTAWSSVVCFPVAVFCAAFFYVAFFCIALFWGDLVLHLGFWHWNLLYSILPRWNLFCTIICHVLWHFKWFISVVWHRWSLLPVLVVFVGVVKWVSHVVCVWINTEQSCETVLGIPFTSRLLYLASIWWFWMYNYGTHRFTVRCGCHFLCIRGCAWWTTTLHVLSSVNHVLGLESTSAAVAFVSSLHCCHSVTALLSSCPQAV